jgi:site-specific DNA-methyltransferase (adenine-specific)/modification methylase
MRRKEVIGDCTLYLGDCLEVMPTLGKVDAVVTDPPYGIKVENNYSIGRRNDKEKDLSIKWDKSCVDLSYLPNVPKIIWGANYYNCFDGGAIVWDKQQPLPDSSQCEIASISGYNKVFKYEQRWTNFVNTKESEHPTEKPVDLMIFCLQIYKKYQTILDPFMGSGTTGIACAKMGRKFIGIELDEKYFDIACERIEAAYAQGRLFA